MLRRRLSPEIVKFFIQNEIEAEFISQNKHLKYRLTKGDKSMLFVFPLTPSDKNGAKNSISDIKRKLLNTDGLAIR